MIQLEFPQFTRTSSKASLFFQQLAKAIVTTCSYECDLTVSIWLSQSWIDLFSQLTSSHLQSVFTLMWYLD